MTKTLNPSLIRNLLKCYSVILNKDTKHKKHDNNDLKIANLRKLFSTQPKFRLEQIKTTKGALTAVYSTFSFSAILVCFIDAQIHSCFREKMSEFGRQ